MSIISKRLVAGINANFINIISSKNNFITIDSDNNGLNIVNTNNNVQSGSIALDPPISKTDNVSLTQPNDVLKQANINIDINATEEGLSELLLTNRASGLNVIKNSGVVYNLSSSNNNLPVNVGDKKVLVIQKNANSISLESVDSNMLGGNQTDDDSNKANLSLIDNVFVNNNTFNYSNNNRIGISGIYNQASSGEIIVLDNSNKIIPSTISLSNLALLNTSSLVNYSSTSVNNSLYASLTNTNIFSGSNTFSSLLLSGGGVGKVSLSIPTLANNYTITLPSATDLSNNSTWVLGTTSTSSPYNLSWIDIRTNYLQKSEAASTYLTIATASSTYLTSANAASTYLTQANAISTYLTSATAASTYLTSATAETTYLTQTNAISTYLTIANAASTYLTSATAASTYLTQSTAASTYLTQSTAASTYLTQSTAASTYGALSSINAWSGVNTFNLNKLALAGNGGNLTLNASQSELSAAYTLEYPGAAPLGAMNVLTTSGSSPFSKYTWTDLSTYLTSATASSTYLTQADASSTYLTQSTATSTYLTSATATSTYLPSATAASTYLTSANASSTYLTSATAASTYLTSATATSTYLTSATAASTYDTLNSAKTITGNKTYDYSVCKLSLINTTNDNVSSNKILLMNTDGNIVPCDKTYSLLNSTLASGALTNVANTFTAAQTFTYGNLVLNGVDNKNIILNAPSTLAASYTWNLPLTNPTSGSTNVLYSTSTTSPYNLSWLDLNTIFLTQSAAASTYMLLSTANNNSAANTWSGVNTFNVNKLVLAGNANLVLNASQTASSTAYTLEYPTAAPVGTLNVLTSPSGTSTKYIWTDLSTYLTSATAASTYLTSATAASTYLTSATAGTTYLTQTNAASTYLTQTNAGATYMLLSGTNSNLAANTWSGVNTFNANKLVLAGNGGNLNLNASQTALSTAYTLEYPTAAPSGTMNILTTSGSSPYSKYTWTDLSTYLTSATAASTYLTSATAASTYLTSATAASTYLTSATAGTTYLTQTNAGTTYMKLSGTNSNSGTNAWTGVNTFNVSNPIVITNPNSNLTTASSTEKLLAIDTSTGALKLTSISQNSINGGITTSISSLFDEEFSFESGSLTTASYGVNEKFKTNMTVVNSGGSIITDNKLSYFSTGTAVTHFTINSAANYYPFGGGTAITLSTWIKWNNTGTTSGETEGISLFTGSDFSLFTLKMNSGDLSFTYFALDGSRPEVILTSFTSLNPVFKISNNLGKWVFLSATLNSSNNTISVYIRSLDSTLYSGSLALSTAVNTTSGIDTIGRFKFVSTNNNGVNIANFFITKSALTNAQLDMLANINAGNIISTNSLAKSDAVAQYTGLSGTNNNSAINTWSGVNTFNANKLVLAGNGGNLNLNASQTALSTAYTLEYPTAAPSGTMNVLTTSGSTPYSKYTWTDLSTYLTSATAASTYLTSATAASTYLTTIPASITGNKTFAGNLTAVNLYNYGYNAQVSMTGGGNVTWNAASQLYWDTKIFIGPLNATYGSNGYIQVLCPTSGTISYYNGANTLTTVACNANGIQFDTSVSGWNALYYVVTPGQASTNDSSKLMLVNYANSTWNPSSNWVLIACVNNDTNALKWMPCNVIIPQSCIFYTQLGSTKYTIRYVHTFASGNSNVNITSTLSSIPNGIYSYICTGTDLYNNLLSIVNGYFVKSILGTTYYGISNTISYQKTSNQYLYLIPGNDSLINATATDIYAYNKTPNGGIIYSKIECLDTNPPPDLLPMPPTVTPYAQFKFETFSGSDLALNSYATFTLGGNSVPKVAVGKYGGAIRASTAVGQNVVYIHTHTLPAMTQGCTFMTWYKEADGTNIYLLDYQGTFYKTAARFNVQNNGNMNLLINGTTFTWTRPTGIDYVNTIVHYALVFDLSQTKFLVYVNGALVQAKSYSTDSVLISKLDGAAFSPSEGVNDAIINGSLNGGSQSFVDDYRMYITPVSAEDIAKIYASPTDTL